MGDLLVETKLLVPQRHRELVPRRRLTGIVERASTSALTVVSAPAGFGKTTLLAQLAGGLDARRPWAAVVLREHRPSPRDPRSGLTMLLAPAAQIELHQRPPRLRDAP